MSVPTCFSGLAAPRGAINSIMAELIEDRIHNHMPWDSKSSEEAAEDVIEIVKSYLKQCKSTRRLRAEGTDTHRYFWRASSREQSLFER